MFHDTKLFSRLKRDAKFNYLRTAGHFKSESGLLVPNLREMIGPMAVLPGFFGPATFGDPVDLAQEPGQFAISGSSSDQTASLYADVWYLSSFSAVVVGGGGAGSRRKVAGNGAGGGGGGLTWANTLTLLPFQTLNFQAGKYGSENSSSSNVNGGPSKLDIVSSAGLILTVHAYGGSGSYQSSSGGLGGSYSNLSTNLEATVGNSNYGRSGGGAGGNSSSYGGGGGGAAGYGDSTGASAIGGLGGNGSSSAQSGTSSYYGGGGGGTGSTASRHSGGGGGVGLFGSASGGTAGSTDTGGSGGSGGSNGGNGGTSVAGDGGAFGGGGGGSRGTVGGGTAAGNGGPGAIRIMWGAGRAYPYTNTADV